MTLWPFKPKRTQVQVVVRDRSKLKLHEFRADNTLANAAAKVLADPIAMLMTDVLRNEHPAFQVFHPETDLQSRAAHQAKCEGYTLALANLEAMGKFEQPAQSIEPTFEKEEVEMPQE